MANENNSQFDAETFYSQLNEILSNSAPDLQNYVSNMLNQSAMVFLNTAFPQLSKSSMAPSIQNMITLLISTYVLPSNIQEKK